jgi:two-component system, LuxR family, response regulator FixJ
MNQTTIIVIDDHDSVRASLRALLESSGYKVKDYASAPAYLADGMAGGDCLLVDLRMPDMNGLELQEELVRREAEIPVIVVTGHGDVTRAVAAMKAGAFDFIEKPFDDEALLASIQRALVEGRRNRNISEENRAATELMAILTGREREVMEHLVLGKSNKLIAHELGISPRTVEIHRARVQEKLKARDLSDLVRLARAAGRLH